MRRNPAKLDPNSTQSHGNMYASHGIAPKTPATTHAINNKIDK